MKALVAFLMSALFAASAHAPVKALVPAGLTGVAGWALQESAQQMTGRPEFAAFAGGLAAGLVAEFLSQRRCEPATLYTVPGILPLVPGEMIYRGMLALAEARFSDAVGPLSQAVFVGGALAAGLALPPSWIRLCTWRRRPPAE